MACLLTQPRIPLSAFVLFCACRLVGAAQQVENSALLFAGC